MFSLHVGYNILVYLQGFFLHCVNTRQQEMLCHSLFLSGETAGLVPIEGEGSAPLRGTSFTSVFSLPGRLNNLKAPMWTWTCRVTLLTWPSCTRRRSLTVAFWTWRLEGSTLRRLTLPTCCRYCDQTPSMHGYYYHNLLVDCYLVGL